MQPIEITPALLAELREKAEKSIANDFDGDIKGDGRWYRSRLGYTVYSVKTEDIMAKVQGDYDADFVASANPAVMLALVAEIERLKSLEKPPCKHWYSEVHECWQSDCSDDLHISEGDEPFAFCPYCGGMTEIVDEPETEEEER